jgi:hypothetical protein
LNKKFFQPLRRCSFGKRRVLMDEDKKLSNNGIKN